tara:strand:+ start:702 stop:806 length:105 start_codon:yes stop_codon:yes gene_type:complete
MMTYGYIKNNKLGVRIENRDAYQNAVDLWDNRKK